MSDAVVDPCASERCRMRDTPKGSFEVPRHIVRLDIGEHTNGWQVRFEHPSRFFSDRTHGGSAAASLHAACAYLRSIYRPIQKKTMRGKSKKPGRTPGIRITRNKKGHWYVEATALDPSKQILKRFYVGTDKTRTEERLMCAWRKAQHQRIVWMAEIPPPLR